MLANLAGKPLLGHVIDRVGLQALNLAINGLPQIYGGFGLPVFPDAVPGKLGPLAGILTAMEWAAAQGKSRILTVSGDTPFVPKNWAQKLGATPDNVIALPQMRSRSHHICGLWPSILAPDLRKFMHIGESFKVRDFLALHDIQMVEFPMSEGVDPFFNINTRADMERAEIIVRKMA